MDEARFEVRARRAYERGRLGQALRRAAVLAPIAALAFVQCTRMGPTAMASLILMAVVALCSWRGQDLGRGARAGLLPGLAPFVLPLVSRATGLLCGATVCAVLPSVCVVGGMIGGVTLGTTFRGPRRKGMHFWLAALTVTVAAGAVGCIQAGLFGLVGMLAGVVVGSAPVLVLRRVLASAP